MFSCSKLAHIIVYSVHIYIVHYVYVQSISYNIVVK